MRHHAHITLIAHIVTTVDALYELAISCTCRSILSYSAFPRTASVLFLWCTPSATLYHPHTLIVSFPSALRTFPISRLLMLLAQQLLTALSAPIFHLTSEYGHSCLPSEYGHSCLPSEYGHNCLISGNFPCHPGTIAYRTKGMVYDGTDGDDQQFAWWRSAVLQNKTVAKWAVLRDPIERFVSAYTGTWA